MIFKVVRRFLGAALLLSLINLSFGEHLAKINFADGGVLIHSSKLSNLSVFIPNETIRASGLPSKYWEGRARQLLEQVEIVEMGFSELLKKPRPPVPLFIYVPLKSSLKGGYGPAYLDVDYDEDGSREIKSEILEYNYQAYKKAQPREHKMAFVHELAHRYFLNDKVLLGAEQSSADEILTNLIEEKHIKTTAPRSSLTTNQYIEEFLTENWQQSFTRESKHAHLIAAMVGRYLYYLEPDLPKLIVFLKEMTEKGFTPSLVKKYYSNHLTAVAINNDADFIKQVADFATSEHFSKRYNFVSSIFDLGLLATRELENKIKLGQVARPSSALLNEVFKTGQILPRTSGQSQVFDPFREISGRKKPGKMGIIGESKFFDPYKIMRGNK